MAMQIDSSYRLPQIAEQRYCIHISLFFDQSIANLKPKSAFKGQLEFLRFSSPSAIVFDRLFDELPDNAQAGCHRASCHTQKKLLYKVTSQSPSGKTIPLDVRFGPIQIDWADRIGYSTTTDMSNSSETTTSNNVLATTSSLNTHQSCAHNRPSGSRKKKVFLARNPQIAVPVATFDKHDSFRVDDGGSNKDKVKSKASNRERFQGMTLGAAEVAFGMVHLYRDKQEALNSSSSPTSKSADATVKSENQLSDSELGSIVAILAVPSYLTASDFLSFIEPASEAICHLRMIRHMQPNRCMVLIKFRDASDAEDFHKMFNGQPFNAMDPQEICQVVYVTSVTISKHNTLPLAYPMLANSDPWPLKARPNNSQASSSAATSSEAQLPPPPSSLSSYELPTCPVCLERMDSSVTGLMTISCQHTFHCSCLSKWGEARCPVCRYSQAGNRAVSSASGRARSSWPNTNSEQDHDQDGDYDDNYDDQEAETSSCSLCQTQQDLWVCLICASVGCGRYKQGHANLHFQETGHLYSLELETQRVWDYAGDGYVHRLIQNKADGKLVELPSASSAAATPERSRRLPNSLSVNSNLSASQSGGTFTATGAGPNNLAGRRPGSPTTQGGSGGGGNLSTYGTETASSSLAANEKIEAIGLEYSYLLTSQLESQRHFYQEKIEKLEHQLESFHSKLNSLESITSRLDSMYQEKTQLEQQNVELIKEKEKTDKRAEKMLTLARSFEKEMQTEKSLSQGLLTKLEKSKQNENQLKGQVQELEEQVRDLMFFLETRDKVEQVGSEEMKGADVELLPSNSSGQNTTKRKGKKKGS